MIVRHHTAEPCAGIEEARASAEVWLVGAVLRDPAILPSVLDVVCAADFLDPVARGCVAVFEDAARHQVPIDAVVLRQELRKRGGEANEFATPFLLKAAETPTATTWSYYAAIVREASRARRLKEITSLAFGEVERGDSVDQCVERLLDRASSLTARRSGGGDVWRDWRRSIDEAERRVTLRLAPEGSRLNGLPIGPGQLVAIGAPPGRGKTALALQLVVDGLIYDEQLVAVVANVEMDPAVLLDRQTARLAHVPLSVVRDRGYQGDDRQRVLEAADALQSLHARLHFLGPPFTMPRVRALAASVKADLVVIDYLQRFTPSAERGSSELRAQVGEVMTACRELAMSGPAVIAISAMSRQGDFRESSEIEYGADACYTLEVDDDERCDGPERRITAKCRKNRHGAPEDIELVFDGRRQEFTACVLEPQEWDYAP